MTDRFSRSSSSAVKEKALLYHLRNKASVTQQFYVHLLYYYGCQPQIYSSLQYPYWMWEITSALVVKRTQGARCPLQSCDIWWQEVFPNSNASNISTSLPSRAGESIQRDWVLESRPSQRELGMNVNRNNNSAYITFFGHWKIFRDTNH